MAEYIFRRDDNSPGGHDVECINYWPSGAIHSVGVINLDQFIEGLHNLKEKNHG